MDAHPKTPLPEKPIGQTQRTPLPARPSAGTEFPAESSLPPSVELTSGAAQFGIRLPVFLESSVLDRYAEIDFALGLNTAGVILSLLACRVRAVRSAVENEVITVCLLRREDAQLIELDLRIHRVFLRNRHCLLLVPEQERAAAFGLHQFCRSENNIS